MPEFNPVEALRVLEEQRVRYVVIGALAAGASGAPVVTGDLDITPARDSQNLKQLATALQQLEAGCEARPILRGVPFVIDVEMLAGAESWTLITRAGNVDVIFEPADTGGFDDLRRDAQRIEIGGGVSVLVASLADVVRTKEAAARPKDLAQLPLLRQTLERLRER